jgi:3-hydroxybutyryl-CoA dehydrogenase
MVKFVESIGKIPAIVNKEIYGFIVNRIFSAITKEACYMYDQGVASFEDIDKAVKYGCHHPMGPFELLDLTGIDLEYDVLMEKYRSTGDLADKPSPALIDAVRQRRVRAKDKEGFLSIRKIRRKRTCET